MSKVFLGETRREAINAVQERLGPLTPRPVAEKTFWTLGRRGIITLADEGYLIEEEITDSDLRQTAKQDILVQQKADHRAGQQRGFTISHANFKKARIGSMWKASSSALAPSLDDAEGYSAAPADSGSATSGSNGDQTD